VVLAASVVLAAQAARWSNSGTEHELAQRVVAPTHAPPRCLPSKRLELTFCSIVTKLQAKVGRPPRTSPEEILEEAEALLREEGFRGFSMRQLATRLGTAPTAIYTFYEGKDELLQALAQKALEDLWVQYEEGAHWEKSLHHWMMRFRSALLEVKWLGDLIAVSCSSPSLLSGLAQLAGLLERAGLSKPDAALTAQSLLWTVLGFVTLEINAEQPELADAILDAPLREGFEDLTAHLALGNYDELYAVTVENAVAGIAGRIA